MKVGLFTFPVRFASNPPIDIAYLASYLFSRGHEVYVRDFNADVPVSNDCDSHVWNSIVTQRELFELNAPLVNEWVQQILAFDPDVVGISVWEEQQYFSSAVARMIKCEKKEIKIVVGGPWLSQERLILRSLIEDAQSQIDFGVFGEGENTLAEIVEFGDSNQPIAGCVRRVGREIFEGEWREEVAYLDTLPLPDYSHFDFNKYLLNDAYPILLTRGCSWNCSFCTYHCVWRSFRSRSVENVFQEIEQAIRKYPFVKKFVSCDHALNANVELIRELCIRIVASPLHIKEFSGYGQVKPDFLDDQLLALLKKAGFNSWGIGMQSGSDRVLKSMRRPYDSALAEAVLERMHAHDIRLSIDIIIGYPNETEEDFIQTLNFISRIHSYVGNIHVTPHCRVYKNDLAMYPERYGIYQKGNDSESWESVHSTPSIRARRYKTIMDHISSLGVSARGVDQERKFREYLKTKGR